MKLSTFIPFLGSPLAMAAVLDVRQQQCSENGCYRAVWGDGNPPRIVQAVTDCQAYLTTTVVVHPITTVTILTKTTSTTTTSCATDSTTSVIPFPTNMPTLSAQHMNNLNPRQASSTDWFTTTTYGPFPSYASQACRPVGYASACSCAGITQSDITYLGTSKTSTATTTLTEILTRSTSCVVISRPASRSSSTSSAAYTTSHASEASSSSISSSLSLSLSSSGSSTLSSSIASSTASSSRSSSFSSATSSSSSAPSHSSSSSSLGSSTSTSSCTTTGPSSHSSTTSGSSSSILSDRSSTPSSSPSISSSSSSSISLPSDPSISISLSELSSSSHSSTVSLETSSTAPSASSSTTLSPTASTSSTSFSASSSSSITVSTSPSSIDTTSTVAPTPSPPICGGVGVELCDGGCHDTKTDLLHCGRCGNKCAAGKDCINGVCASPPCDSRCGWDRLCGNRNGTVECTCATVVEGSGVCFDKNKYKCDDTNLIKCQASAFGRGGCPVGSACVKEYCNCGTDPSMGICVKTEGCGDGGAEVLGPLVKLGEAERRRRTVRDFGL